jgi:hypothetical protein
MDQVLALQKEALSRKRHAAHPNERQGIEEERDKAVDSVILGSLRFATMKHRHEEITEAHQKIFFLVVWMLWGGRQTRGRPD